MEPLWEEPKEPDEYPRIPRWKERLYWAAIFGLGFFLGWNLLGAAGVMAEGASSAFNVVYFVLLIPGFLVYSFLLWWGGQQGWIIEVERLERELRRRDR